jgi:hypothetical protein
MTWTPTPVSSGHGERAERVAARITRTIKILTMTTDIIIGTFELTVFHESAHAVLAMVSAYHNVALALTASAHGVGEAPVAASRKKLDAAGKPTDPALVQADPDYARELTRILLSGVIAEQIRSQEVAEKRTLPLNVEESGVVDLEAAKAAMAAARLDFSAEQAVLAREAEALVRREWDRITRVAVALEQAMGRLDSVDAYGAAQVSI